MIIIGSHSSVKESSTALGKQDKLNESSTATGGRASHSKMYESFVALGGRAGGSVISSQTKLKEASVAMGGKRSRVASPRTLKPFPAHIPTLLWGNLYSCRHW